MVPRLWSHSARPSIGDFVHARVETAHLPADWRAFQQGYGRSLLQEEEREVWALVALYGIGSIAWGRRVNGERARIQGRRFLNAFNRWLQWTD